jgi:hypothetical protein
MSVWRSGFSKMELLLVAAILAVLIIIAVEISVLINRISLLSFKLKSTINRKPEASTINVHVGTLVPVAETKTEEKTKKSMRPKNKKTPESKEEENTSSEAERLKLSEKIEPIDSTPAVRSRALSTNQLSVKCPHCGAENSTYRIDCFQCGSHL